MRRMIRDEIEHGDWYHTARNVPEEDRKLAMANAKQTFDAMERRGLVGPDARPTPAAIAAAE